MTDIVSCHYCTKPIQRHDIVHIQDSKPNPHFYHTACWHEERLRAEEECLRAEEEVKRQQDEMSDYYNNGYP